MKAKRTRSYHTRGTKRKKMNPQVLIMAGGFVVLLIILLYLLFNVIFGGNEEKKTPDMSGTGIGIETPDPSFNVFGGVSTPAPAPTQDPFANIAVNLTPEPVIITPSPEPSYETLRDGSTGTEVKKLQQALIALGYLQTGDDDGNFGPGTTKAVKKFQQDSQLSADGLAGKQTLKLIYSKYGGNVEDLISGGQTGTTQTQTDTTDTNTTTGDNTILNQPG